MHIRTAREYAAKVKEHGGQCTVVGFADQPHGFALNQLRSSDPNFQRVWIESQRSGFAFRYSPLNKTLNLSPDQIARFGQRLSDSIQEGMDVAAASQAKGVSLGDPAILALVEQEKAKFEADLGAIFGEAGLREFQRYDRTYGAREVVATVLGNMVYADAPLSSAQANQLSELIAQHSPSFQRGNRVPGRAPDVRWDGVLAGPTRAGTRARRRAAGVVVCHDAQRGGGFRARRAPAPGARMGGSLDE